MPEPVWPMSATVRPGSISRSISSSTGRSVRVLEAGLLEGDAPVTRRQLVRIRRVGDVLGLVDHLEDPLARGRGALRLADPHARACAAA